MKEKEKDIITSGKKINEKNVKSICQTVILIFVFH